MRTSWERLSPLAGLLALALGATSVLIAGEVSSAPLFLITLCTAAGAFRADGDGAIDPAVAAALYDVSGLAISAAGYAAAVLVLATGLAALRTRALPWWL